MSGNFPEDWFRPDPSQEGAKGEDTSPAGEEDAPAEPVSDDLRTAVPPPGTTPGAAETPPAESSEPAEAPPAAEPGASSPAVMESPTPFAPRRALDDDPGRWELKEAASVPVLTSAHTASNVDIEAFLPSPDRRGVVRRRLWLFLVSVVVLALAAGLAGGTLIRRALDDRAARQQSPVPVVTRTGPARQPWNGSTAALLASGAVASCTAPPSVDGSGQFVSYAVDNVLDDERGTAWRCNGEAKGSTLTFTFRSGSVLVGVGVVNGYAKTVGKTSLYDQYRRVVSVRWDMPDGTWFVQNLSENSLMVQQLMIPEVRVDGPVRMTILATTPPGQRGDVSRDAVLVSTVQFLTKG